MRMIRTLTATLVFVLLVLVCAGCGSDTQALQRGNQAVTTSQQGAISGTSNQYSKAVNWPVLTTSSTPDAAEAEAVRQAAEHSRDVAVYATKTFDISTLPTAYIDDASVPLSTMEAGFVQQVRDAQGKQVAIELLGDGYLTYMKAFYVNWKVGVQGWDRIEAKAKSEGVAELKALYSQELLLPSGT